MADSRLCVVKKGVATNGSSHGAITACVVAAHGQNQTQIFSLFVIIYPLLINKKCGVFG